MKTALFKSLVLASFLGLLAVGCGKDGGSGGGSSVSNLSSTALPVSGQQALDSAKSWYAGSTEGTTFLGSNVTIQKVQFVSSSGNSNCTTKTFLGIPYQYCTSSSTNTGNGSVISTVNNVNLKAKLTGAISSKGNTELNNLFNGSVGTLAAASTLSASAIRLDFTRTDGSVVSYIIDKSYHSLLNPVEKIEQSASSVKTTITQAQIIAY